jgi:DUF438 domain-containing protein
MKTPDHIRTSCLELHPVKAYFIEADVVFHLLNELNAINVEQEDEKFLAKLNGLSEINRRILRIKNHIIPLLAKHFPMQNYSVFESIHEKISNTFLQLNSTLKKRKFKIAKSLLKKLTQTIKYLLYLEEDVLFPTAILVFTNQEWQESVHVGNQEDWIKSSSTFTLPKNNN